MSYLRNLIAIVAAVTLLAAASPGQSAKADVVDFSISTINVPGSIYTFANGINNAGEIAGSYAASTSSYGGGFFYSGGVYNTFNSPPGSLGGISAYDVNDAGQIVGVIGNPQNGNNQGFVYSNGNYTVLNYPSAGPLGTIALGINDRGQVVGNYYDNSTHGFFYSNGIYTALNFPGAVYTFAYDINNRGDIVGIYGDGVTSHGYLYRNGVYTAINNPLATATGFTWVFGINDRGQFVGTYATSPSAQDFGFLFDGNSYVTLDDLQLPQRINDRGQIVGYSEFGNVESWIATPIHGAPEPATWAMMLLGFAGLGFVGYRRRRKIRNHR